MASFSLMDLAKDWGPAIGAGLNYWQQSKANDTATGQLVGGYKQGLDTMAKTWNTAQTQSKPYQQFGLKGLNQYQNLLANPNAITKSKDYKFRYNQGQTALERSAAAKGMHLSGNTLQDLQEYGQGFATRELDAALQRRIPMIETGLTTQNSLNQLGGDYAGAIADIYGDIGAAEAGGTRAGANVNTGGINDVLGILSDLGKAKDAVEGAGSLLTSSSGANTLSSLGTMGATTAGSTLGALGTSAGASQLAGLVPAGSQYTGMLTAMDALGNAGIGAGANTLAGIGTTGANAVTGAGATTGTVGTAGSTLSSIAAAAPYFAAPLIGIAAFKALSNASGGAKDSNKVKIFGELQQRMQADPSGRQAQGLINSLINNERWKDEGNAWVVGKLFDAGMVTLDKTPALHGSKSQIDLWNTNLLSKNSDMRGMNPLEIMRDPRSKAGSSQWMEANASGSGARMIAAAYGLNPQMQAQYEQLLTANKQAQDKAKSSQGDGAYSSRQSSIRAAQAQAALDQFQKQYLTEANKKASARKIYNSYKAGGYKGDLSKLERYLGIK